MVKNIIFITSADITNGNIVKYAMHVNWKLGGVNVWSVIIRVWLANATTACHATFFTT